MSIINYIPTDNLQFMKSLPSDHYDLAVADPEQGKEEHGGKKRDKNVCQKNGLSTMVRGGNYSKKCWDYTIPNNEYFDELIRISKHQIIWGVQYFNRYFGKGRIVWDKVNGNNDQYDCELAYQSLSNRTELFRYMWSGMMQGKSINEGYIMQGNKALNEKRIHPTHKPSKLYIWTLLHFKIPKNWKIFDPNLGSGSIGIACEMLGYDLDACENDKDYYDDACSWLREYRNEKYNNPKLDL